MSPVHEKQEYDGKSFCNAHVTTNNYETSTLLLQHLKIGQ